MRACLALLAARAALAVSQPDGTVVPVPCTPTPGCPAVDGCLPNVFACVGEPDIDYQADATTEPDTFVPAGPVTITFLSQGGGSHAMFGWYNADPGVATPALYPIFPDCLYGTTPADTSVSVDWLSDPSYAGGEVGFYLGVYWKCPSACGGAFCDVFYSEEWRNNDGGTGEEWVHLLKYQSEIAGCRYYLAWEDLRTGGDNDFEDYVFSVDGVAGACGVDPDGVPGVCPAGSSCVDGVCVSESCERGGECPRGSICDPRCGVCVDVCGDVMCAANEMCDPETASCVPIDPCAATTCDPGEACVDGACVPGGEGEGEGEAESESESEGEGFTGDRGGCGCALGARP